MKNTTKHLIDAWTYWKTTFLLVLFCTRHLQMYREKSEQARERVAKQRFLWSEFKASISDSHFRRMFRMPKEWFDDLCKRIETAVGQEEFKSEEFISTELNDTKMNMSSTSKKRRMFYAHSQTSGGYICGEVKVAIALRLLAGASYLDLAAFYCFGFTYGYEIFHYVIENWINNDAVIKFPGLEYFDDMIKMKKTSKEFRYTGTHRGIISGCIGALDGWLVKIRRPRSNEFLRVESGWNVLLVKLI